MDGAAHGFGEFQCARTSAHRTMTYYRDLGRRRSAFVSDFLEEMHHRQRVWDLASGAPGTNRIEIERGDGRRETHAFVSGLALGKGDVVRIVIAQGGGWGEASHRRPMVKALASSANL